MVLESIVRPSKMERHPSEMLMVGFVYSTLGLLFAHFIFGPEASLAAVFITTIPLIIITMNTVRYEEKKDLRIHKELFLIKEHEKAVSMFMFLFLGMALSYSFWFTVFPEDTVAQLFDFQIGTIKSIQRESIAQAGETVGHVIDVGDPYRFTSFLRILWNNLIVLGFCVLFSFIYGAGAIFILTLNASVVGVAVGSKVREYIADYAAGSHSELIYQYFNSSLSITFFYMFHGVFEISAYIVSALAGGIISVAAVNHDFDDREFWHVVADSADLIILSLILLLVGAITEVYLTPEMASFLSSL